MAVYSLKLRFIYTVLLLSGDLCSLRRSFYRLDNVLNLKCSHKRNSPEENKTKSVFIKPVPRSDFIKSTRIERSSETSEKANACEMYADCSSNENVSIPICHCDKACVYFGDCCNPDLSSANHDEISDERAERMKMAKCDIELFQKKFHQINTVLASYGYYVISTCPETFPNTEIKQKCYSNELTFPVTDRDGLVYSNMYCAVCNKMEEVFFWNFHFTVRLNALGTCLYPFDYLNPNMTMTEKMNKAKHDDCSGRFVPPDIYPFPRICNTYIEYLNNSLEDNQKCSAFTNPVAVKSTNQPRVIYKNLFCVPDEIANNSIVCLRSIHRIFKTYGKAMTVMFQLRPPLKISGNQVCMDDSDVFDPYSGMCATTDCIDDSSCSPVRVVNFFFEIRSNFVTEGIVDSLFFKRLVFVFWYVLPEEQYSLSYLTANNEVTCNNGNNNSNSNHCCAAYGNLQIKIGIEGNGEYIKSLSMKMQDILWSYTETGVNYTFKAKNFDENGSKMEETSSKFQMCTGYRAKRYVHTKKEIVEMNSIFHVSSSSHTFDEIPVSFEAEVFVNGPTNNSMPNMTIQKLKIIYNKTISEDKIPGDKYWPFQVILTYVTMAISCLMLLGTIIIYSWLKLSSSSPGQISQNMMGNILISQLLFMSGVGATQYKTLCLIIGILSHYLWLSAFTWISVFIVRVTVMLRTIKCTPAYSFTENLNLRDYMIGYTVPFLIVVPSVALDLCNCTSINLTYSGDICFPSGYPGNMIVFTLPVLVSLVINMTSFILACIFLREYNVTAPSLKISRSYIPLYTRLCVISACPWILGIIAEITDQNIVRYMYILLAGLHGFFVSLCFLARKKIVAAFRNSSENHHEIELS